MRGTVYLRGRATNLRVAALPAVAARTHLRSRWGFRQDSHACGVPKTIECRLRHVLISAMRHSGAAVGLIRRPGARAVSYFQRPFRSRSPTTSLPAKSAAKPPGCLAGLLRESRCWAWDPAHSHRIARRAL